MSNNPPVQYRTPPNYVEPLTSGSNTSASYYRFFQAIDQGVPPAAEYTITVGPSPFKFTTMQHGGNVLIFGGNITQVQIQRTMTYSPGFTEGIYPLSFGDSLIVTYVSAPTMVFFPS